MSGVWGHWVVWEGFFRAFFLLFPFHISAFGEKEKE